MFCGCRSSKAIVVTIFLLYVLRHGSYGDQKVEKLKITASLGQQVILPCKVALYQPNYTTALWTYRISDGESVSRVSYGQQVFARWRHRFSLATHDGVVSDGSNYADFSLLIRNASRYDSGMYTCTLQYLNSETIRFVHLNIVDSISRIIVHVGEEVTLTCTSNSINEVKWTYIPITTRNPRSRDVRTIGRFTLRHDDRSATYKLIIHDVTTSDAGRYVCIEDGGFGTEHPNDLIVLAPGDNGDTNTGISNRRSKAKVPWNGVQDDDNDAADEEPEVEYMPTIRGVKWKPIKLKDETSVAWHWAVLSFMVVAFCAVLIVVAKLVVKCRCISSSDDRRPLSRRKRTTRRSPPERESSDDDSTSSWTDDDDSDYCATRRRMTYDRTSVAVSEGVAEVTTDVIQRHEPDSSQLVAEVDGDGTDDIIINNNNTGDNRNDTYDDTNSNDNDNNNDTNDNLDGIVMQVVAVIERVDSSVPGTDTQES